MIAKKISQKVFYISTGTIIFVLICLFLFKVTGEETISNPVPGSCTIFMASFGEKVLFGNNEDYNRPKTYYWTEPRTEGNYGCIYVGFENYSLQGGINEKGLCFDANALPEAGLKPHKELPTPPNEWVAKTILKKAATVEEAIKIAGRYQRKNWGMPLKYQIILADAKGDGVVISAGKDKELAFTRKKKGNGYLVSTNFNRANPKNAYTYPCWRYNKAVEMLGKIENESDLTVDYFKNILDAAHVEGARNNTLYSNIFDPKNGIIYLYHWHQYDEVAKLNVSELLAKGKICKRISNLFSKETVDKALAEYQKYKEKDK